MIKIISKTVIGCTAIGMAMALVINLIANPTVFPEIKALLKVGIWFGGLAF